MTRLGVLPLTVRPPDSYASQGGVWHARRGVGRPHTGIDALACYRARLVLPWDVTFLRSGQCYSGDPYLRLVAFRRVGEAFDRERWRALYVRPGRGLHVGDVVPAGMEIGTVQDLSRRYPKDQAHPGGMWNHVHFDAEVQSADLSWQRIDPTPTLLAA